MKEGLDQSSESLSVKGWLGKKFSSLQEASGVLRETSGALRETSSALFDEENNIILQTINNIRGLFENFMNFSEKTVTAILGNESVKETYKKFSDTGIPSMLGFPSLGLLIGAYWGGEEYENRQEYVVTDLMQVGYLEDLITENPSRWNEQKRHLKEIYQYYLSHEEKNDTEEDSVAGFLKMEQNQEYFNSLSSLYVPSIVNAVSKHKEKLSPSLLYTLGFTDLFKNGKGQNSQEKGPIAYEKISDQQLEQIVQYALSIVGKPSNLHLLRLGFGKEDAPIELGNAFVASVFGLLIGMKPGCIEYNIDGIWGEMEKEDEEAPNASNDGLEESPDTVEPIPTIPLSESKVYRSYDSLLIEHPVDQYVIEHFSTLPSVDSLVFKPGADNTKAKRIKQLVKIGNMMKNLPFSGWVFPLMALQESGWKLSQLALQYHNYTGIKDFRGGGAKLETDEKKGGKYVPEIASFRVFKDDTEFAQHYESLLNNSRYRPPTVSSEHNALKEVYHIVAQGYATAGPEDYVFGIDGNNNGIREHGIRGLMLQIDSMIDWEATNPKE